MKRASVVLFVFLAVIIIGVPCFSGIDRIGYRLFDDFETGEFYAWEPYPYQQDIGYDPTFLPQSQPAHNDSRYALARIVRPNQAIDLSQGFNKRIDMWTTRSTSLELALFLMSDRRPQKVDLMLGTFDGRLFVHRVDTPNVNRWVKLSIPVSGFSCQGKPLGEGEHIQVVAVKAFYPVVTHLMTYTILIDDVSLTGERTRQFIGKSPQSTFLEHFGHAVLHRHFTDGEAVSLSVAPEGGIKLKEVCCDLVTPVGSTQARKVRLYDDGTHGDQKAEDGVWSNGKIYSLKSGDPRGQWTARLTGKSDEGDMSWGLRFIVPVARITSRDHPRLYFGGNELRNRIAGPEPKTAKKILENILSNYRPSSLDVSAMDEIRDFDSESLTGGPYSSGRGNWYATQRPLREMIVPEAWRYAFTGGKEAGERAKAGLLKLCSHGQWNHPWHVAHGKQFYYPTGQTIRAAALGYDLLHDLMTEEERALVRKGIMKNGIKPFYRSMVELNGIPSSLSNHIGVILSGVGLAASALYNDDTSIQDLEPYFSGILAKTKQLIDRCALPEGSYLEPYTYQSMALRELVEALYSFERLLGVDYTSTTYLKEFYYYPMYVVHAGTGKYQDVGDVSLTYTFNQAPTEWLVFKMKDPFMYGYAKPWWESGGGGVLGYLWYTEGIEPRYRDSLPTSKHFKGKGHMVMRSSWADDGTIAIFRAGPNSNHHHADQGTLLIMANGEELLSDAGHSSSYYENPFYAPYYTQAIGHNTLLLDMNAESQAPADFANGLAALNSWPRIIHSFAGEIADAVEANLACVYKDTLSSYTRTVLYTKNGPMFLFDRVSSPEPHAFNWIFHAEHTNGRSSIAYSDNRVTITRSNARLTMDVISPESLSGSIRSSDRDESFIALSSPMMNDAVFLAVLTPEAKQAGNEFPSRPPAKRIAADGWMGAELAEGDTTYKAFFRVDDEAPGEVDGFNTDASRFTAELSNGRIKRVYFEGTSMSGYGAALQFTAPVTAVAVGFGDRPFFEIHAAKPCRLTFTPASRPSSVLVDGRQSKNWKFDQKAGTLTIDVPEGRTDIKVG